MQFRFTSSSKGLWIYPTFTFLGSQSSVHFWSRRLLTLGLLASFLLGTPAALAQEGPTALQSAEEASPLRAPAPRFLIGPDQVRARLAGQPLEESLWRQALPGLLSWLLWQEHLPLETVKNEAGRWLVLNRALENRSPMTAAIWQGIAAIYLLNNERANAANALARAVKLAPEDLYTLVLQVVIGQPGQTGGEPTWEWDLGAANKAFQAYPKSALAQYIFAEATRRHESAMPAPQTSLAFLQATQLAPDAPLYHLQAGRALLAEEQMDLATHEFQQALRLTAGDALVLEIIGNIYAREKQYDDAIAYYRQSLAADGRNPRVYSYLENLYGRQARWDEVIQLFQSALKFFPGEEEVYDRIALAHRNRGASTRQIAQVYQDATRANPGNANLFATMGFFLQESGQTREAMAAYRRAIALNPRFGDAYNSLASLYWREDEVRPILTLMQEALRQNPGLAIAHYWLANADLRLNKVEGAIDAYKKAVELEPNFPEAYNMLGIAYRVQKREDLAVDQFRKAVQLNNRYIDAWMNLGDTYDSLKRFAEAAQTYQQVAGLRPYDPAPHFGLGNVYTATGEYERAAEEFYRTILIRPGDMNARNNLGNVFLKQGQHDRALEEFRRILVINPQYASAYYNIACSFALRNQPEQAFPYLSQAIKLDKGLRSMARSDPDFSNIRQDHRFLKLVE